MIQRATFLKSYIVDVVIQSSEVPEGEELCTREHVVPVCLERMFGVLNHDNRLISEHRYAYRNIREAAARRIDSVFELAVCFAGNKMLKFAFNLCIVTCIGDYFDVAINKAKQDLHQKL